MNKEDILQKEYASRIMNWEKAYKRETFLIEAAHAAMDQYSEQEAISFAEWMNDEDLKGGRRVGNAPILLRKTPHHLRTIQPI